MKLKQEWVEESESRSTAVDPTRRMPRTRGEKEVVIDSERLRSIVESYATRHENALSSPSAIEFERMFGQNDLVDDFYLERALIAAQPVGRIAVREGLHELGYGTGFLVAPRVLMTNWHVLEQPDWRRDSVVDFDYRLDLAGNPVPEVRFRLAPDALWCADERLDYALVGVAPLSEGPQPRPLTDFGHLRLIPKQGKIFEGEWMTIIQHPGGRRRQFAIRANELLEKKEEHLWYVSDTAHGSSGAPVFNDQLQVVALHHMGRARRKDGKYLLLDGKTVESLDEVDEGLVDWEANEGIRISIICRDIQARLDRAQPLAASVLEALGGDADIMSRRLVARADAFATARAAPVARPRVELDRSTPTAILPDPQRRTVSAPAANPPAEAPSGRVGAQRVVVPIDIELDVRVVGTKGSRGGGPSPEFEADVMPRIDPDYATRQGYQRDFLGIDIPMPEATDLDVVSRLSTGEHVIPYHHFSLVLHKERRLALFTASMVDHRNERQEPEPGFDYTRDGLGGLGENDSELWFYDPRVPLDHQVPNRFYVKDRKAFDRGHIVRRDDVTWGGSYREVWQANGDTFHVTNCSPQVGGFNQSSKGGWWGKLENLVGSESLAQDAPYVVFAGPVFQDSDPVFQGVGDSHPTTLDLKIPRSYWKIVVARHGQGVRSYGFELAQDLTDVDFERERFWVPSEWKGRMIRLADLVPKLVGMQLPDEVIAADQYDRVH